MAALNLVKQCGVDNNQIKVVSILQNLDCLYFQMWSYMCIMLCWLIRMVRVSHITTIVNNLIGFEANCKTYFLGEYINWYVVAVSKGERFM